LAFVQELVKLHGGNISAESEKGKGTTFTVSIPTGAAHLPGDRVVAESSRNAGMLKSNIFVNESMSWLSEVNFNIEEEEEETSDTNAITAQILVVDDNADMREYVCRILGQHTHWKIRQAGDGLQALEAIEKEKPDLVLSDVMMPNVDGFQLLKALKDNPKTAAIPVILLSARAGEEATIEGLEKGADDYLVKPFSARELMA